MALRVLLADESTTIKKVMQLALQDFAVEVKAVHAGVDVLDVARSFQPDVIFADVLLQKKNGYEVCGLLKADAGLKAVPVILMWSSFMDLDDKLAKNAGAEGRLEKPFDVETLRKLVLELVPKTRTQRLAHFLDFPQKPTEELRLEESSKNTAPPAAPSAPAYREPAPVAAPVAPPVAPPTTPKEAASWSMESFDDPAAFADEIASPEEARQEARHESGNEGFDDEDEMFKPLELSNLGSDDDESGSSEYDQPEVGLNLDSQVNFQSPNLSNSVAGDDESWTHQDLSRFKLDLPPVTFESDEGAANNIRVDMGEDQFQSYDAFDRTDPLMPIRGGNAPRAPQSPSGSDTQTRHLLQVDNTPLGDLRSDFGVDYGTTEEIELPENPLGLEDEAELSLESSTLDTSKISGHNAGKIQQMDAKQLEEIIRAQSRDIIEAVVRKIVPDLATAIIREELERLLEETAVRDSRGGKGPNL